MDPYMDPLRGEGSRLCCRLFFLLIMKGTAEESYPLPVRLVMEIVQIHRLQCTGLSDGKELDSDSTMQCVYGDGRKYGVFHKLYCLCCVAAVEVKP